MNIKQEIRRRHKLGEIVQVVDVLAKNERKADVMRPGIIVAKYRDYAVLSNGVYKWCVNWLDIEGVTDDE